MSLSNILASRYASAEVVALWAPEHRAREERRFWVSVLEAQFAAGLDVPDGVIDAYKAHLDDIDLASIEARERVTRHDVKARIEEFNALAGHEFIHRGLTSRDVTENVEQKLLRESLAIILERAVAVAIRLARLAAQHGDQALTARSHNVPAQVTTLGKRFASAGEELLIAIERCQELLARYPARGLRGPVGTQQDLLDLLGSADAVESTEAAALGALGFDRTMTSVGQVYPRSLDYDVLTALSQLTAGPASLATTIRLMAGHDLVTEGFKPGQVGSSAMPHKMNARFAERVSGLRLVVEGYVTMVAGLAGAQWNEGDVACSVVRRVALPDACFAVDGLFQTMFEVLDGFGAFPAVIEQELERYMPFLSTTKILMAAVRNGVGREEAHEAIKEHALAAALAMRETGSSGGQALIEALGADARLGLGVPVVRAAIGNPMTFIGTADRQVEHFCQRVERLAVEYPSAVEYQPKAAL